MAIHRHIEGCKGALLVPVTSFTLKIQLLPINCGHWSTKTSSRLSSLLPPAHSPKLQSSEPYPKGHTIIWKIHKYSLGWFSASLDGFTDLCKSGTHRFHHYLFATANTASVLAANHRHHHHQHRRHSTAEALLFAKLIATII
jgi:hypothetical protein